MHQANYQTTFLTTNVLRDSHLPILAYKTNYAHEISNGVRTYRGYLFAGGISKNAIHMYISLNNASE